MTMTIDEILAPEAPVQPEKEVDLERLPKRSPPKNGLCLRCGRNKPVNRLMLCYPCWVKADLEDSGWKEGMPHPDSCNCETGDGHSARQSFGN